MLKHTSECASIAERGMNEVGRAGRDRGEDKENSLRVEILMATALDVAQGAAEEQGILETGCRGVVRRACLEKREEGLAGGEKEGRQQEE